MIWNITECNIIFTQVLSYLKSLLSIPQLEIYNLSNEENLDEVILSEDDDTPRNTLLLPYHTVIIQYLNEKLIELGTTEIKPMIQKILSIFDWGADLICTTKARELADCIGIDTENELYDQDRFIFAWTNLMTSLCLILKLQYLYLFEQTVDLDCCNCNKGKGQTQENYESWSSGVYPNDEVYDRTNYARTGSSWGLTTEPGKCECNRHE